MGNTNEGLRFFTCLPNLIIFFKDTINVLSCGLDRRTHETLPKVTSGYREIRPSDNEFCRSRLTIGIDRGISSEILFDVDDSRQGIGKYEDDVGYPIKAAFARLNIVLKLGVAIDVSLNSFETVSAKYILKEFENAPINSVRTPITAGGGRSWETKLWVFRSGQDNQISFLN